MRIAIDVREACRVKRTGKGQWVYGFVSELLSRQCDLVLFADHDIPLEWQSSSLHVEQFHTGLRWHFEVVSFLKQSTNLDLYLSPTSYIVPFLLEQSFPYALVIHDLTAFFREPHDKKAKWIERSMLQRVVRNAAHVFSVSESTKTDLLERYSALQKGQITPIFAGPMKSRTDKECARESTILCIGTLCPRKNQGRLIRSYTLLPEDLREKYSLILVGSRGWSDQTIVNLAEKTNGVEWRGFASEEEYDRLLRSTPVLALPSLYEGFGMQILDALQRGIPILTSKRGAIPEVVGDTAVFVDPESEKDIARGLEIVLRDRALQNTLRRKGPIQAEQFSWKRTVDLFLRTIS